MAVDVLHDVELGFGKDVPLHVLRLLHVVGGGAVQTFDARLVPESSRNYGLIKIGRAHV